VENLGPVKKDDQRVVGHVEEQSIGRRVSRRVLKSEGKFLSPLCQRSIKGGECCWAGVHTIGAVLIVATAKSRVRGRSFMRLPEVVVANSAGFDELENVSLDAGEGDEEHKIGGSTDTPN